MVGSPLEEAEAQDHAEGDTEAQQHRLPPEAIEIAPERRVALRHFGLLLREIRVVQFLDLLRDRKDGVATRHHVATEKAGALNDLFRGRPVDERIERLPIVFELLLE